MEGGLKKASVPFEISERQSLIGGGWWSGCGIADLDVLIICIIHTKLVRREDQLELLFRQQPFVEFGLRVRGGPGG
jgi:hypothetical protein